MANIRTAMNRGAFDFVTKPIDFVDLKRRSPRLFGMSASFARPGAARLPPMRARVAVALLLADLAERLASDGQTIDLGGQRRGIATLFTDITGSTTRRDVDPEVLQPLLNDYLTG